MSTTTSPLQGIDPNTLDELMSRDPMEYSTADLEKIVRVLREQRAKWTVSESAPKGAKKRAATQGDLADLSKDLGL